VEASLDLSRELIGKEEATFFVRVAGDSMTEAGIHDGDILVVDRSVEPESGSIAVAALDGDLTVKRYEMRSGYPYFMPEAEAYDPIPIEEGQGLRQSHLGPRPNGVPIQGGVFVVPRALSPASSRELR
jgi:DNA polymerase V